MQNVRSIITGSSVGFEKQEEQDFRRHKTHAVMIRRHEQANEQVDDQVNERVDEQPNEHANGQLNE